MFTSASSDIYSDIGRLFLHSEDDTEHIFNSHYSASLTRHLSIHHRGRLGGTSPNSTPLGPFSINRHCKYDLYNTIGVALCFSPIRTCLQWHFCCTDSRMSHLFQAFISTLPQNWHFWTCWLSAKHSWGYSAFRLKLFWTVKPQMSKVSLIFCSSMQFKL